jgi:hypothetical protein
LNSSKVREPLPIEDDANLHDVQFVGSRAGWAVGDHGVIWHSEDGGETWTDLGPAFVGPYGNMNAIYDTVLVKPRTFIATAQPDSNILRSIDLPPVAFCHDVTVPTDPGTCSALTASNSANSTRVAWLEKTAKLTPCSFHVAPKGRGSPS